MGLKAEDGCPNGTEKLWVTVQAERVLEVACKALAVYLVNIISSGVFDGVKK